MCKWFNWRDCLEFLKNKQKEFIHLSILLGTISIILISLFLLPIRIQDSLRLNRYSPSLVTMYITNFLHSSWTHLILNIIHFIFACMLVFIFSMKMGELNVFYKLLGFNLILFPFLFSAVWLLVIHIANPGIVSTFGFSGIVSSLYGSSIMVYIDFIRRKINFNDCHLYYSIVFLSSFVFSFFYFQYHRNLLFTVIFFMAFCIFYFLTMRSLKYTRRLLKDIILLSLPVLMVFAFSMVLFPLRIGKTDILTHCFAFLAGQIFYFSFKEKLSISR